MNLMKTLGSRKKILKIWNAVSVHQSVVTFLHGTHRYHISTWPCHLTSRNKWMRQINWRQSHWRANPRRMIVRKQQTKRLDNFFWKMMHKRTNQQLSIIIPQQTFAEESSDDENCATKWHARKGAYQV